LSADVKVHTMKPKEAFEGEVNVGIGSFGYQKGAVSLSGGTENVKFLLSASTETSDQYEDGNGDDFADQIQREIDAGNINMMKNPQYQDKYRDREAYTKKTLMAKMYWDITDTQELRLSYTANRSDNVLYPSSKMDALYDDSDIYNIEYIAKDLGTYSKELSLQVYQSEVEHPMSTKYRKMGAVNYITHALTTKMQGAKIKNSFDIDDHTITAGIDYSLRNWDGGYLKNGKVFPEKFYHSIWDVDTKNVALFLKDEVKSGKLELDFGLRYDNTEVTSANPAQQSNEYDELNGYVFATYNADANTKYFAGVGKSSRVPDGKELYWVSSPMQMPDGSMKAFSIGTPNLEATINYEFDIGMEKKFDDASVKVKVFYSKLEHFIAYNSSKKQNRYENVDASIYGLELSGTYIATEALYFDYGMSYQRGEKDSPLAGQSGTNMPEIPPFKFNLAANYEYDESLTFKAELIGSDEWTDFDVENGEQALDTYVVLNLKSTKNFGKNIELTVGIDNVLDDTYAVSNTYNDLILLPTTGDNNVMLMNEPGRYVYANVKYKF
ncbi:MAG TPA: TonB-dependent receptor, partial [Sulfurovum sp.]|nr:TonB-dependent receptor [Sulfurovum sp.]